MISTYSKLEFLNNKLTEGYNFNFIVQKCILIENSITNKAEIF